MKEGTLAFWPKITVIRYLELHQRFQSTEAILSASEKELAQLPWRPELLAHFIAWQKSVKTTAAKLWEQCSLEKISVRLFTDPEYPRLLKEIHDPPVALFIKGTLPSHQPALAVVGSRATTEYGRKAVAEIVPLVASAGISIVSGLATGIDTLAHQAALQSNGHTVAVLGFGISNNDLKHSQSKQQLAQTIIDSGGAVISEYVPGTRGTEFTFPKRNRIIAGLCHGTLIVEAKADSGALITADCARQANREIMVIPHSIFSTTSAGINVLLKEGAHPITQPEDIAQLYGITPTPRTRSTTPINPEEQQIISELKTQPRSRDELARISAMSISKLATLLTNLEIQGIIEVKNNYYHVSD